MNKYLEKIALHYGFTLGGAALGGLAGGIPSHRADGKKLTTKERLQDAGAGAALGAGLGFVVDHGRNTFRKAEAEAQAGHQKWREKFDAHNKDWFKDFQQRQKERWDSYGNSGRSSGSSGGSGQRGGQGFGGATSTPHPDLEAPAGGFKTKAEATKHYRKMSMKWHPDRPGGDNAKMQKINSAWDNFKKPGGGFEKLAKLNNRYINKVL